MAKSIKMLIRLPNHLGDCLMSQPAIKAFAESNHDDEIHLLGPLWAKPIFDGIESYTYLPLAGKALHGSRAISIQALLLRKYKFDAGILLTPSFSSALILFLAGVKNRYGYSGEGRSIFLNHSLAPIQSQNIHRSVKYFRLLEYLAGKKFPIVNPSLCISQQNAQIARQILIDAGMSANTPFIVIAPQAVAESRRWGSDNYAALSRRIISETSCSIILLGTADEYPAGESVAIGAKKIINLCGKTNIATAAAVLSLARLFIGNDSGLAHLAAAVNIPLVVLSGAGNPIETSPLSDKKTVIIKSELDCISCVKNRCPQKGDDFMKCMREITIDEVFSAAARHLGV